MIDLAFLYRKIFHTYIILLTGFHILINYLKKWKLCTESSKYKKTFHAVAVVVSCSKMCELAACIKVL